MKFTNQPDHVGMTGKFTNPERAGRPVHSPAMRELLGLAPKAKLPREGMPGRYIQGIYVWVTPLVGEATQHTKWHRAIKRSAHRVRCICPKCGQEMSAGRLFQHTC